MAIIVQYRPTESHALCATVAGILEQGGLVAVPTETYYGLGVNPFDVSAVQRVLQIKGRSDGKPILVLIGTREQLALLVAEVPQAASLLMDAFWPGPLTIVLPAKAGLPDQLTAGTGAVGVRLSSCGLLVELLAITGPLTGTSANRAGGPPAQEAIQVQATLGHDVDLIVDAGPTPGGLPSTVVDARGPVRLIREGAVTRQMLQNVLQTRGISLT